MDEAIGVTVQDLAQWGEEFEKELLDETGVTFVNDIDIDIIRNFLEFEQELLVIHHDDTGITFVSDDEVPDIIYNFKDKIEEWGAEIEDELLKTRSDYKSFEDVKINFINDDIAEIIKNKVEPIILNVTLNNSAVSAKDNGDTDITKITPAEKKPIKPYNKATNVNSQR